MKLSRIGRISMALVVSVAMGLGMTACGGGTIGYMWVLGTQYNQIAGFKIDDFTGNLTNIVGSPFSSGGTNPVSIAVKPGGRYVYVVNAGTSTTAGNIAEFSVGGDGILTFQAAFTSQGGLLYGKHWIAQAISCMYWTRWRRGSQPVIPWEVPAATSRCFRSRATRGGCRWCRMRSCLTQMGRN